MRIIIVKSKITGETATYQCRADKGASLLKDENGIMRIRACRKDGAYVDPKKTDVITLGRECDLCVEVFELEGMSFAHKNKQEAENMLMSYVNLMANESPRGGALTIGGVIEAFTKSILKEYLESEKKKELLSDNGPLGPVYHKILLMRSLNIIDKELFNEIHLIIQIRNRMAHNWFVTNLEHDLVRGKCFDLPWYGPEDMVEERKIAIKRFEMASMHVTSELYSILEELRRNNKK